MKLKYCDIHYALKANSEMCVLKVLNGINSKFEVASQEEFDKLLKINVPPERIICGLPIKKPEMIKYLYQKACNYFVFDDIRELMKIKENAPNAKKILRIYLSDIVPRCIEYGMEIDKINHYCNDISNFFEDIDGISFHISNNVNIDYLTNALDRVEIVLKQFPQGKKFILNIGGSYSNKAPLDFYDILNNRLKMIKDTYNVSFIAEPGATIVRSAGKVITTVIMVKERGEFNDVFIDAGSSSGVLRQPGYINNFNDNIEFKRRAYRFIDITCMHKPLFMCFLKINISEGNILELGDFGDYSVCFCNSFHAWEKPKVMVK